MATSISAFISTKEDKEITQRKWKNRRIRHFDKFHGGVKNLEDFDDIDGTAGLIPLPISTKPSVYQYFKESVGYVIGRKVTTEDKVDNISAVIDSVLGEFKKKSYLTDLKHILNLVC